ncbi:MULTISPECIES: MFS transporter [unclassified Paenibacillus]|uniref:MFS transporter n=1 Tax=unclassified Paenibacillus TaxID=185978 RepID=UPI0010441C64|nr:MULTISPECIES: MFS transporter [unclassified Paenibacillus]NIK69150.1 multidrug resistance protein [Paenibacillus sp. BK720]TCM92893.1 multidrug resistance protein [Paenibacillus sp. BK033]
MVTKQSRSALALLALAISSFAIGTTEFISVGLLPLISEDLNISVTTAGLSVTLYAVGVTVGAPLLTALTSRVPRKTLLIAIMIIFILGNSLAASAGSIAVLLIARVISSFSHGVFMSIGSTIAADLVPEDRRASAIAMMFSGLTVATVTGVPLGTLLGQHMGWRTAFIAIAVIGVIALIANLLLIPNTLRKGNRTKLSEPFKVLKNGRLLLAFAITMLGYGGTFVVFTYLSPLLHDITGFKESTIAGILVLYGVAIAVGNIIGGKAANKKPLSALLVMFILQAVILLVLTFTAPYAAAALVTITLMGLLAFMNVPGLQMYVVLLAERYMPKSIDVVSALNISAFNAGIAIGAYVGGIITDKLGLVHTPWIGAIMVLGAVALTAWSRSMENKDAKGEELKASA